MSNKLTTITPQYHSFVPDQVLTDKGLNEVINYFEDQTRLSRICLSGVGRVCGFEITAVESTTTGKYDSVTITPGAGVTTDGDLLHFLKTEDDEIRLNSDPVVFNQYAAFDNSANKYAPFWYDPGGGEVQMNLIELLPGSVEVGAPQPLNLAPFNMENKVIVLFLECFSNPPGSCTLVSCDNQGQEEVRRLRVLLVDILEIQYLIDTDTLFNSSNVVSDYLNVNCVVVPRVILNESNTDELVNLATDYHEAMTFNNNITALQNGFNIMLNQVGLTNENTDIQNYLGTLFDVSAFSNTLFQYRYDLLKDIVDSYCELKELFIQHYSVCCPDINAFPKHLMLGFIDTAEREVDENPYRHPFYKSPILDCGEDVMARFSTIVTRVVLSLENYIGSTPASNEILITPSNLRVPLGKRAVPFYYDSSSLNFNLIKNWDFDRSTYYRYNNILGYRQSYYSTNPVVNTPLIYNLDPYNFYRIEGHQGWQYAEALETINNLKEANSLPFDVKVLGITIDEAAEINVDDYACDFQDLDILLKAWKAEQLCSLGEVTFILSGFSTNVEGLNINEEVAVSLPADVSPNLDLAEIAVNDPCAPDRFTDGNVVIKYITTEENTLGKIVGDALVKSKYNSSVEINAYIQEAIGKLPLGTWKPISVSATLSLPGSILSSAYALTYLIPDSIQDLDSEALINYSNEIARLCTYTKQLQSDYADGELVLSKNIMALVDLLNNQLTNICCSAKKLQTLFQEVIDRKLEVLTRLKFSVFAEQHPGLEHLAGVIPGGTFVMVYVLQNNLSDDVQTLPIPSGTVVADFSLPYLCCSDCAPINFIVPKSVVSLSLTTNVFCMGTEDGLFVFDVSPIDGVIETVGTFPGVSINGTEMTITAAEFDPANFGVPIKFTVNQQYTDAYIIVRKRANVDFNFDVDVNTVTFTPTGEISNSTFEWNFGDGTPLSTLFSPTHVYNIPLANCPTTVTATLTVTPNNGSCPVTVEHEIPLPEVTVTIGQTDFCYNDVPYPFTITPDCANPVIEGIGVTADHKFFDPRLTKGLPGPFDIKFEGELVATITVRQPVVPTIVGNYVSESLELSAVFKTPPAATDTYKWEFFDADSGAVLLPTVENDTAVVQYTSVPNPTNLLVQLTFGTTCGEFVSRQVYRIPVG